MFLYGSSFYTASRNPLRTPDLCPASWLGRAANFGALTFFKEPSHLIEGVFFPHPPALPSGAMDLDSESQALGLSAGAAFPGCRVS